MRKSNLGTGSVQRPGIRPRGDDGTPINRLGRKSHLPKALQPDSGKRGSTSRFKRGSTEGLARLSLASMRYTPNRNNIPSINTHAGPPSGSSRMSVDTVRSSMGGKSRKETRPLGDPAFKNQCIDKVLDFLVRNGYECQLQRRNLYTPSTRDFARIFNFVYVHLDSSYLQPNRVEEEIPRILKLLKYPIQMPKSSFITVGSPHTWPSVLAMLAWLVDIVNMMDAFDPVTCAFPSDFESDINITQVKFSTCVNLSKNECDTEKIEAALEEFRHALELVEGVRPQDMVHHQEEFEELERMMDTLNSGPERLKQLQFQCSQIKNDLEKMNEYCREMQVYMSSKDSEQTQLEDKLSELNSRNMQIKEQIASLEILQAQQALSAEALARFKNHANDVAAMIAQLQNEIKDLDSQVWGLEMETGKLQKTLCDSVCSFNTLIRQLELPSDCEISSANVSGNLHHWQNTLLNELRVRKKNAKQDTYLVQTQKREKEGEVDTIREMFQDKADQTSKLENKLRRVEENILLTKTEIAEQEREMNHENEWQLHEITEARKARKGSLFQKQFALEEAKKVFKETQTRVKDHTIAGTQFLVHVGHIALENWGYEQREAAKFKVEVEKICFELTN
nr:kinetochore protein NDC80 homolog [Procambarus clarkii]